MGRPKLKEDMKKEKISITLPSFFKDAVMSRGNASSFVEDTVRLYLQFEDVVSRLAKSKNPSKDVLSEFEDILDSVNINMRRGHESVPADEAFKKLWNRRR